MTIQALLGFTPYQQSCSESAKVTLQRHFGRGRSNLNGLLLHSLLVVLCVSHPIVGHVDRRVVVAVVGGEASPGFPLLQPRRLEWKSAAIQRYMATTYPST